MNKVRIAYTVSLSDVPRETQALVEKLNKENGVIENILSDLDFTSNFELAHEKLKSISLALDRAQTVALDALTISEGYMEIQNSASTRIQEEEVETTVSDEEIIQHGLDIQERLNPKDD